MAVVPQFVSLRPGRRAVFVIVIVKWTLPKIHLRFAEDRLLGKIEFLKHLNEYLSNIFILALCSVDDWLL